MYEAVSTTPDTAEAMNWPGKKQQVGRKVVITIGVTKQDTIGEMHRNSQLVRINFDRESF